MQSASPRIWTRVAVSISSDDNRYTTGTSFIQINDLFELFQVLLFDISNYFYEIFMCNINNLRSHLYGFN